MEHRGVKYIVAPRTPCPGLCWKVFLPGTDTFIESRGAFYDAEDHPEGAETWAASEAVRFIDKYHDVLTA